MTDEELIKALNALKGDGSETQAAAAPKQSLAQVAANLPNVGLPPSRTGDEANTPKAPNPDMSVKGADGTSEIDRQIQNAVASYGEDINNLRMLTERAKNQTSGFTEDMARGDEKRNINDQTAAETRRWQRLVDAFNAKTTLSPATWSSGLFNGPNQVKLSEIEKYPVTLNTVESRQWEDIRKRAQQRDTGDIERQLGWKNLDLTREQLLEMESIRRSGAISDAQRERYNSLWAEGMYRYRQKNDMNFRIEESYLIQELMALKVPRAVTQMIIQTLAISSMAGHLLADVAGTVAPDVLQLMTLRLQDGLIRMMDSGASPDEINKWFAEGVKEQYESLKGIFGDAFWRKEVPDATD